MRPIRVPRSDEPALDDWSYARRRLGTDRSLRLTPAHIDRVRRTVMHAPEVLVKVTGGGGASSSRHQAHFSYISRRGELEIETDDVRASERAGRGDSARGLESGFG